MTTTTESVDTVFDPDNILVALRPHQEPDGVLVWSARVAQTCGADIDLVSVVPPFAPRWHYSAYADASAAQVERGTHLGALAHLRRVERKLSVADLDVRADVFRRGDAADTICEQAERRDADLVVIGHSDHGWLQHLIFGSVCRDVVRGAPCSALIAPRSEDSAVATRRVVVGTDFSSCSGFAVRAAAELAEHLDAVLHVVHVYATPSPVVTSAGILDVADAHRLEHALPEQLDHHVRTHIGETDATQECIRSDDPASVLARLGEVSGTMLVVGSHGRTGLPRLLLGSVAERVVDRATAPVLVARVPDEVS